MLSPEAMACQQRFPVALTCPRDGEKLIEREATEVACPSGHRYPVVDGIPVLLRDDAPPTMRTATASLARATHGAEAADPRAPHLHLESLGVTEAEKEVAIRLDSEGGGGVDPVVSVAVGATCGMAYRPLAGRIPAYPIPQIRLPPGAGKVLLDVGCGWGRWTIAAARLGYLALGIDPSLGAALAAQRAARACNAQASFLVADARFLPFPESVFDCVFSYSVLQHFETTDAATAVAQIGRVLRPGGSALVQMAHRIGVRSLYHQLRRRFRAPRDFEVRYWALKDLEHLFQAAIGPTTTSVDCYFGLGLQPSDRPMLAPVTRAAISASEALRALSRRLPALIHFADSVYLRAQKRAPRATSPGSRAEP